MTDYRPLLDIIVTHIGLPLPDGCDVWGIRAVHPDFRSSRGFRWPWPGGVAEAAGPILNHRGSCPEDVGDGICTAKVEALREEVRRTETFDHFQLGKITAYTRVLALLDGAAS